MREINKPEQMASSDVKPTPEQLRAVESRKREIAAKLDSMPTDIYGSTFSSDFRQEKNTSDSDYFSSNNSFWRHNKEKTFSDPRENDWRENKEYINNEILPSADAEVRAHIYSDGLDKYIPQEKLERSLSDCTEALLPSEMQEAYEKKWFPGITGFNDGRRGFVDSSCRQEQAKETAIHEYYHQLSNNYIYKKNGKVDMEVTGLRYGNCDVGLNEALTQKYTLDTLRDGDPSYDNPINGYADAVGYLNVLYSYDGNKDLFDQAYFQNKPELLRDHFDSVCGNGFYDKLSKNFDIITSIPYTSKDHEKKQEALAKTESLLDIYKASRKMRDDNEFL